MAGYPSSCLGGPRGVLRDIELHDAELELVCGLIWYVITVCLEYFYDAGICITSDTSPIGGYALKRCMSTRF